MIELGKLLTIIHRDSSRMYLCSPNDYSSNEKQSHTPPLVLPTSHQYFELAVCMSGTMRIISHNNTWILNEGDAILIEPNAWHYETYNQISKPYQSLWLTASSTSIGMICATYKKRSITINFLQALPPMGESLALEQIRQELLLQQPHWQMKTNLLLCNLFIDMDRHANSRDKQPIHHKQEPVQRLYYIIKNRFREPLQIRQLAQEVGMSADYLSRCFHLHYGVTFKHCLNSTRIHYARHLLNKGQSIKETSEACGFEDIYYFTKIFKEYCGTTPGRYLKSQGTQT